MKVYEITKRNNSKNVFGISLVATPAMESNYIKLSKENTLQLSENEKIELSKQYDVQFSEYKKDKRLLLGLVLEPNKLIYRYDQASKEEYYITVSSETILELAHDYIKNSNQNYSTIEHDGKELDGVSFVEHWIVEDSKIDKSALHGLNFKKGSWVTVAKIDNETIWNDYIETGNVMGFSIDAMVHLEEINLKKQEEMSETKTVLEFLKDLPNKIALAISDKKEDVKEVEEKVELTEDVKEIEVVEEVELSKESKFDLEEFKKVMDELGVEFATVVKEALKPIQETNVSLSEQVKTLEEKVVELEEQPASKAIKTAPQNVDFSKMTDIQKYKYHRDNG